MQENRESCWRLVRRGRQDLITSGPNGRFHAAEPTSYAADSIHTAIAEITAQLPGVKFRPDGFQPVRINTDGLDLADLTDLEQRERWDTTRDELRDIPPPARCRSIANQLRAAGYDGAIYESARLPGARCLVLFLDNIDDRLSVEPIEWDAVPEDLPLP